MSIIPPISPPAMPGPTEVIYPSSDGRPVGERERADAERERAETEGKRAQQQQLEIERLRGEIELLKRRPPDE